MDYLRVLEDMLRAYVLDHKGRRAIALNGIRLQEQLQASIQMAPYEALYGRPCRSPVVGPRWERASSLVRILLETPMRR